MCTQGKKVPKNLVYIGVHVRRHDSIIRMIELYDLWEIRPSYYLQAIQLYKQKFKNRAVFLLTSDDMGWVQQNIIGKNLLTFSSTNHMQVDKNQIFLLYESSAKVSLIF